MKPLAGRQSTYRAGLHQRRVRSLEPLQRLIERVPPKEQLIEKERGKNVHALIPLNLDGYLLEKWRNGEALQIRERLVAGFRGWKPSHKKCEARIEMVIRALSGDEGSQ